MRSVDGVVDGDAGADADADAGRATVGFADIGLFVGCVRDVIVVVERYEEPKVTSLS